MEIKSTRQENTSWTRWISFNYDGKDYDVVLYHQDNEGYDLVFKSENGVVYKGVFDMPDWAKDWDEDEHDGMTLEHYLDDLTYNTKGIN